MVTYSMSSRSYKSIVNGPGSFNRRVVDAKHRINTLSFLSLPSVNDRRKRAGVLVVNAIGAMFNWVSKVIRDCISFALLHSVIGQENSRHPLSQSDVTRVFPCKRPFTFIFFEFSLARCEIYRCCDWPWWFTLVLRHSIEKRSNSLVNSVNIFH